MIFALFFANEFTVGVARVALATSATPTVNKFAKNSAKITRNVTNTMLQNLLQFSNVTVGVVGYFLGFVCRLRIKSSTLVLFFHF